MRPGLSEYMLYDMRRSTADKEIVSKLHRIRETTTKRGRHTKLPDTRELINTRSEVTNSHNACGASVKKQEVEAAVLIAGCFCSSLSP